MKTDFSKLNHRYALTSTFLNGKFVIFWKDVLAILMTAIFVVCAALLRPYLNDYLTLNEAMFWFLALLPAFWARTWNSNQVNQKKRPSITNGLAGVVLLISSAIALLFFINMFSSSPDKTLYDITQTNNWLFIGAHYFGCAATWLRTYAHEPLIKNQKRYHRIYYFRGFIIGRAIHSL